MSKWMLLVPTSRAAIFIRLVIVTLVMKWWQRVRSPFDPNRADENGLVAIGGSLVPQMGGGAHTAGGVPRGAGSGVSWGVPAPRRHLRHSGDEPPPPTQHDTRRRGVRRV